MTTPTPPATGRQQFEAAMRHLNTGAPQAAEAIFRALLADAATPPLARARVLFGLGRALCAQERPDDGASAIEEGIALARSLQEAGGKAAALVLAQGLQTAAFAALSQDRLETSETAAREAVERLAALFGALSPECARARFDLAASLYRQQNFPAAEKELLAAKTAWEAQDEAARPAQYGTVLNNLGRLYEEMGNVPAGITLHEQAVAVRRALPNREDLAFSLGNLGVAWASIGEWEKARTCLNECLAVYAGLDLAESDEARAFAANLALAGTASEAAKEEGITL